MIPASSDYVIPVKLNWPAVLDDLKNAGISGYKVSVLLDVSPGTIYYWRSGQRDPQYAIGSALLTLHSRYCGEALTKERQLLAPVK